VPFDKFGQCQSNGVAEVGTPKPGFRVSNDPFGQGAFEQFDLVHGTILIVQPANLIRRELGMDPGINPIGFVATVGMSGVWFHSWLEAIAVLRGTGSRLLLNELSEGVFQKYLGSSGPALSRIR
jgi:hypothetical protein